MIIEHSNKRFICSYISNILGCNLLESFNRDDESNGNVCVFFGLQNVNNEYGQCSALPENSASYRVLNL